MKQLTFSKQVEIASFRNDEKNVTIAFRNLKDCRDVCKDLASMFGLLYEDKIKPRSLKSNEYYLANVYKNSVKLEQIEVISKEDFQRGIYGYNCLIDGKNSIKEETDD